jgi:hypothetical protein
MVIMLCNIPMHHNSRQNFSRLSVKPGLGTVRGCTVQYKYLCGTSTCTVPAVCQSNNHINTFQSCLYMKTDPLLPTSTNQFQYCWSVLYWVVPVGGQHHVLVVKCGCKHRTAAGFKRSRSVDRMAPTHNKSATLTIHHLRYHQTVSF